MNGREAARSRGKSGRKINIGGKRGEKKGRRRRCL